MVNKDIMTFIFARKRCLNIARLFFSAFLFINIFSMGVSNANPHMLQGPHLARIESIRQNWMKTVGQRVSDILKIKRISAAQASENIGLSEVQLVQMLKGLVEFPAVSLQKLAEILGTSIEQVAIYNYIQENLKLEDMDSFRPYFIEHLVFFEHVFTAFVGRPNAHKREEIFRELVPLNFWGEAQTEAPRLMGGRTEPQWRTQLRRDRGSYGLWQKLVGLRLQVALNKPRVVNGRHVVLLQRDIAQGISVQSSTVSNLINGKISFSSYEQGLAAAIFLNVDADWLLGFDFINKHIDSRFLIRNRDHFRRQTAFTGTVRRAQARREPSPNQDHFYLSSPSSSEDNSSGSRSEPRVQQPIEDIFLAWKGLVHRNIKSLIRMSRAQGRQAMQFTEAELAQHLGASLSELQALLNGSSAIRSLNEGWQLAELFHVNLSDLLRFDFIKQNLNLNDLANNRKFLSQASSSGFREAAVAALNYTTSASSTEIEGIVVDSTFEAEETGPIAFTSIPIAFTATPPAPAVSSVTSRPPPQPSLTRNLVEHDFVVWKQKVGQNITDALERPHADTRGVPYRVTQSMLATQVSRSQELISLICSGHQHLTSLDLGIKIAAYLNVDPQSMLEFEYLRIKYKPEDLMLFSEFFKSHLGFDEFVREALKSSSHEVSAQVAHRARTPIATEVLSVATAQPAQTVLNPHGLKPPLSLGEFFVTWRRLVGVRFKAHFFPESARTRLGAARSIYPRETIAQMIGQSATAVTEIFEGRKPFPSLHAGESVAKLLGLENSAGWLMGYDYLRDYAPLFTEPARESYFANSGINGERFREFITAALSSGGSSASPGRHQAPKQLRCEDLFTPTRPQRR